LYTVKIHASLDEISGHAWNALAASPDASPFVQYEYLHAMEASGSATTKTGWTPCHFSVWQKDLLVAALPLYLKHHSYGEYVFDWAWANAYQEHGLKYFPKLLSAIPFTPVGGLRILGDDQEAVRLLIKAVKDFANERNISSIHILFPPQKDASLLIEHGFLRRESVQFHWQNQSLERPGSSLESFQEFLYTLNKKRRNNILRERESIIDAGIHFEHLPGQEMQAQDWDFFYECYSQNYFNHGNSPYLTKAFFLEIGESMGQYIHLIFATYQNKRIASSLLFRNRVAGNETAYGRYWGAVEHVKNLHFETAYYQSIEFCIREGIQTFEGGAQGEHKIHRGLTPVNLYSMHYLSDQRFYRAVQDFLEREGMSMYRYINELSEHNPIKQKLHD
jgi:uncharacterized protein